MKDTWKDYFSFNKRQRNGIFVLLSLLAVLLIYLFISDYFPPYTKPADFSLFKNELEKSGVKANVTNLKYTIQGVMDINTVDTTVLKTLPKMTSYCAEMIVRYRKKLGGYYSTRQLKEVWGMDSGMYKAVINNVRTDTGSVNKININTADVKELAYHPYIHYYLAKAIVNYREEHGLFVSLSALHNIVAIDDSTYVRIMPYLTVGKN